MILSRWQGHLLVVPQPEHGTQTGLFAAAWGNEDVVPVRERAAATTLAARHHDDGWLLWERHPSIDPSTSQPVQFAKVVPTEHVPAYRAGIARLAQLDPWAGLLASMHGSGLYNDRFGTWRLPELGEQQLTGHERALVDEFLADMTGLQRRLAGQVLGHDVPVPHEHPEIRAHYLLLQVWDRLSLQFALRHGADGEIAPLPSGTLRSGAPATSLTCRAAGTLTLRLDPYPFIEDTVFPVRGYLVADRAYASPEDFVSTLARAAAQDLECRVRR